MDPNVIDDIAYLWAEVIGPLCPPSASSLPATPNGTDSMFGFMVCKIFLDCLGACKTWFFIYAWLQRIHVCRMAQCSMYGFFVNQIPLWHPPPESTIVTDWTAIYGRVVAQCGRQAKTPVWWVFVVTEMGDNSSSSGVDLSCYRRWGGVGASELPTRPTMGRVQSVCGGGVRGVLKGKGSKMKRQR